MCKNPCFNNYVKMKSSEEEFSSFTSNGRRIICLTCSPDEYSPFSTEFICSLCDDSAIAAYMEAHRLAEVQEEQSRLDANGEELQYKSAEVPLQEAYQRLYNDYSVEIQDERRIAIVNLHKHRIFFNILTPKCPHCQRIFELKGGCFAIKCQFEGPKGRTFGCCMFFCGWCLQKFDNSFACSNHVKSCHYSLNIGSLYCKDQKPMEDFNLSRSSARTSATRSYNSAYSNDQNTVISGLESDLIALKIYPQSVKYDPPNFPCTIM